MRGLSGPSSSDITASVVVRVFAVEVVELLEGLDEAGVGVADQLGKRQVFHLSHGVLSQKVLG